MEHKGFIGAGRPHVPQELLGLDRIRIVNRHPTGDAESHV